MWATATEVALKAALKASLKTLPDKVSQQPSRDLLHKVAAAASGAVGGAFGISGLPVELPVSTTILLRSIAEIARSEGEDLGDPATALACLEVFALGGSEDAETGFESSYLAVRAVLAREVTASVRFLLHAGLAGETAPVLARFLSTVSARFGVAVGEKLAAQGAPVVGALGGAAINLVFASHFQSLARGHFTVRRLERTYGADIVRQDYRRALASARRGARPRAVRGGRHVRDGLRPQAAISPRIGATPSVSGKTERASTPAGKPRWSASTPFSTARRSVVGLRSRPS